MNLGQKLNLRNDQKLLIAVASGLLLLSLAATSYFQWHTLAQRSGRLFWSFCFFSQFFGSLAAILLSFACLFRRGSWPRLQAAICFLACLQLAQACLQLFADLPTASSLLIYGCLASLLGAKVALQISLRLITLPLPAKISLGMHLCGFAIGATLVATAYQNNIVFGIERASNSLSLWLHVFSLCFPLLLAGLQLYHYKSELAVLPAWQNIPIIPWVGPLRFDFYLAVLLLGNALFHLIVRLILSQDPFEEAPAQVLFLNLADLSPWIACAWSARSWWLCSKVPRRINSPFLMDKGQVSRIFRRFQSSGSDLQRHNIGFRTAVLMLDHDPNEDCRSQLPAFLFRARQMQCEHIIRKTFSDYLLSMEGHSSQLTMAIDSAVSSTPCIQALLILSIIHLDGLPLIEQRLRLLAKLFPLLDPDLADHIDVSRLDNLFGKLSSFYYLDFNWVDQSLSAMGDEAFLDIRLEKLNLSERQSVLAQLRSAQWLGNFIWISEGAFERLAMESPYLHTIMETISIRLENIRSKRSTYNIHLIKFENLIPRLQRYYDLESFRTKLANLPIEELTSQRLQHIKSSLEFDGGLSNLAFAINELNELNFVGFKSKDAALELLVLIVKKAESLYLTKRVNEFELEQLFQQCKGMVQSIGYPNQDLHESHLRKLEIREYQQLLAYCMEPTHPRCQEAWLLLASLPERKFQGDFGRRVLELIEGLAKSPHLKEQPFLLKKSIEAFFLAARVQAENQEALICSLVDKLARAVLRAAHPSPFMMTFMDQKVALDQGLGRVLPLSEGTLQLWEKQMDVLEHEFSGDEMVRGTLPLRWRSFRQGQTIKLVS